jgi:hypothetical protein
VPQSTGHDAHDSPPLHTPSPQIPPSGAPPSEDVGIEQTPATQTSRIGQSESTVHAAPESVPESGVTVMPGVHAPLSQTSPVGQSESVAHAGPPSVGVVTTPKLVNPFAWKVAMPPENCAAIREAGPFPSLPSTASTYESEAETPLAAGMVTVTGTANVVPLGSKSTTGPPASEWDGALPTTAILETPMLMVVSALNAWGGMVMVVPAIVASSLAVTVMVPPAAPTDAVFTYLLPTPCVPPHAANAATTTRDARHPPTIRDPVLEIMVFS